MASAETVIITGSSGYVGSALVQRPILKTWLETQDEIRGLLSESLLAD